MNGLEKCGECRYFKFCDVPKEKTVNDYPTQRKDGFCEKIFPRGYAGAGKPGGYMYSGKMRCFQFEGRNQ